MFFKIIFQFLSEIIFLFSQKKGGNSNYSVVFCFWEVPEKNGKLFSRRSLDVQIDVQDEGNVKVEREAALRTNRGRTNALHKSNSNGRHC